jgi:hypothetical protein
MKCGKGYLSSELIIEATPLEEKGLQVELNNFGKVNLRLLKEKALILSRIQIISLSSNNGPI